MPLQPKQHKQRKMREEKYNSYMHFDQKNRSRFLLRGVVEARAEICKTNRRRGGEKTSANSVETWMPFPINPYFFIYFFFVLFNGSPVSKGQTRPFLWTELGGVGYKLEGDSTLSTLDWTRVGKGETFVQRRIFLPIPSIFYMRSW